MIIIVALIFILRAMTRMDNTATAEKPKDNAPYPVATDREISSRVLLGSEGRVVIEHGGQRGMQALQLAHIARLSLLDRPLRQPVT